jgi:hypothetical protein
MPPHTYPLPLQTLQRIPDVLKFTLLLSSLRADITALPLPLQLGQRRRACPADALHNLKNFIIASLRSPESSPVRRLSASALRAKSSASSIRP